MLLMAPQSGKKTRKKIQRKGKKLSKQTTKTVKHNAEQVREKAHQVTTGIKDVVDDQAERWESALEAGKTAVQG